MSENNTLTFTRGAIPKCVINALMNARNYVEATDRRVDGTYLLQEDGVSVKVFEDDTITLAFPSAAAVTHFMLKYA
jgi:hypothetical protein